jgi:hypothetical protein
MAMNLVVSHDPCPVVIFQVFVPHGVVPSADLYDGWIVDGATAFKELADDRIYAGASRLLDHVPIRELVRLGDGRGLPSPETIDVGVALSPQSQLLPRTRGVPSVVIGAQNYDAYDPLPLLLAHVIATTAARKQGGIVYVNRCSSLWDPAAESLARISEARALDFVQFRCSDEETVQCSTTGMPIFGLPEIRWDAPSGTDHEALASVLLSVASRLLRLRRTAGRLDPGRDRLEVPTPLTIALGDAAWAWGLPTEGMADPEAEFASLPLRLGEGEMLDVVTDGEAGALNRWLEGLSETVRAKATSSS